MNTLDRICAATRQVTLRQKVELPLLLLEERIKGLKPPRGFAARLSADVAKHGHALITEIKRQSPSGGAIRAGLDVAACARAYQMGGASCLSILTDAGSFGGSMRDLETAYDAVDLPLLCKDFMLDPYQVYLARAFGADCILIIMAAVDDECARELAAAAFSLNMDVLMEVHDAAELERALALPHTLLGINNRNLKNLNTDLQTSVDLAARVLDKNKLVGESGLKTITDIERLKAVGIQRFLVGESLLRQADLVEATRLLMG